MTAQPGAQAHTAATLAEDIARCVHCGFCLQACPTYLALGAETDSPRGRIALVDALQSGRAAPTPALLGHLDLCLQCRACETACPSGVPYGRIMERARASVLEGRDAPRAWRLRAFLLRALLPHPARIDAAFRLLRLYGRSPLRPLVRRLPALRDGDGALPELPRGPFRPPPQPQGLGRAAGVLTGCVMRHMYPRTHAATVRVLNRLGYRAVFAEGEACCGALSAHAGDLRTARALARRTIDGFDAAGVEAVIVNSAGCGSTMKEYGQLLADDPAYAARAAAFAARTHDILEFVASHALPALAPVRATVTYQDSCHLVHAQRVVQAPRALLSAIPGLELREMAAPDRCCGSAGLYSLVQPAMSRRLLSEKMDDIVATGATTIATANPGCMSQLEMGLRARRLQGRVVHVVELLDEAMRAAGGPA